MKSKLMKALSTYVLFSAIFFMGIANAGIIALDSTRFTGNQDYNASLAMYFDVLSTINVTHLGAYDSNLDGFQTNTEIEVGIFDLNTGFSVTEIAYFSGNLDTLIGNSRFLDITDVTLDVGNYAIVARGFNSSDLNGNAGNSGPAPTIDNGNGLIQFVGGGYYGGSNISDLNLHTDSGPANRYDAGTFIYTSVPEPSTLAIFALGMIGLASRRFKK
jgi:hypothetical protein